MTINRQILQILFFAVFALNTLVYAGSGMAMSGEMAPATTGMNAGDCDDCVQDNISCEFCVLACVAQIVIAMNSNPSFFIPASSQYEIGDRDRYHSYISSLEPFPPRVLSLV
jgi:hypothetical protein